MVSTRSCAGVSGPFHKFGKVHVEAGCTVGNFGHGMPCPYFSRRPTDLSGQHAVPARTHPKHERIYEMECLAREVGFRPSGHLWATTGVSHRRGPAAAPDGLSTLLSHTLAITNWEPRTPVSGHGVGPSPCPTQ